MANFKFVKSATALVLGASVLTTAVIVPGANASAKTTYKVNKNGTLVDAKTNKTVKGYVTYKGKLYKNGKKLTGLFNKKYYYKNGVKATGTYQGAYYVKGAKKVTTGTYNGAYYVKGIKKVTTGTYNKAYYVAGKKVVSTGTYNKAYYVDGKKVVNTGLYQGKYYKDGVLNVGFALYNNELYKDAIKNVGLAINPLKDGKAYYDAILANGTYLDNGVEKAFENGVEVGAKVKSVEAINAKQIKLTFNKSVDKSALDVTNYSIKPTSAAAITLATSGNYAATADFGADSKTVIITLTNPLTTTGVGNWAISEGDVFNFNYDVKTTSNESLKGTTTLKYSDKVAPEFVSAKASAKTATSSVTLTFSEPVDTTQALVSINGTYATFAPGTTPNEVVATFAGQDLVAGKSYDMTILNVKDAAGNLIADNNKKVTVNVTADASAPAITDVKTVSDNLVEVTFDKAIAAGSLTSSAIKFVDGNLASLATVGTPTIKPNTSGKTVLVPLSSITFKDGKVSGNLVFTDAITDTTGNKLSATSKALTLTQDVAAPTVVSSKYVNKSTYGTVTGLTNGAIVVKFSEEVTKSAANTAYTVVNNKGEVVATAFTTGIAVNGDDKTELVLPLTAPVASGITSYKVVLPLSAVVDNSQAANASKSVNLNVDVSAGAVVADDTTAPVVASAVATGATTSTSGSSIAVTFTEANAMDSTTVTDINNYRLNGLPLPAGAYVTYNSTSKVATINIPAGSIAKTSSSTNLYSLNVTGVKDAAGNSINSSASTFALTGLADDVAPELKTATLNSVGQVVLGFSETLSAITAGDFVVKVNGTTTTNFTIIPGTGSDTGKYILTVNDGATPTPANLDLTKAAYTSVTVQAKTNAAGTADSSAVNTNAGNLLAGSQAITVK